MRSSLVYYATISRCSLGLARLGAFPCTTGGLVAQVWKGATIPVTPSARRSNRLSMESAMELRRLRNLAFLAMSFGGVAFGLSDARAHENCTCCQCSDSGSSGKCYQVGKGDSGWTGCQDSSNCSVQFGSCTGK